MVGSGLQMAATRPCTAYSKRILVSTTVSGVKFGSLSSISSVQFLKPGFAPTAFKLNNFVTRAIASKSEKSAPTGLSIDLRGNRAFIAGVTDDNGYGWAIAKALAAAGAKILAGTWVPALNIFETSLRRGKFDGSRKLPDGSLMEITKAYPLDAVYDTPDDVPEDIKNNKRYAGSSKWTEKVSKSTILVLLSALIILVFQPILVQPAYATAVHSANKTFIKSELLSSAWTGFFAGCLHTLSGPDHLAALAPLSIGRTRVESAAVGALWGCGHDAGQLIFGLVFLLLKDRLHIETIQTWGTRVVGLTLLVIGAMGIKEASEIPMHYVSLENGDVNTNEPKKKIGFATFATGIVHGLQPDALMMILPALALPSRKAGAAFLGMFLLGTVIAMGSYTVFIGSCSQALKDRIPRITEKLTWAASLIAISMGVAIIVSQFFGFSLY